MPRKRKRRSGGLDALDGFAKGFAAVRGFMKDSELADAAKENATEETTFKPATAEQQSAAQEYNQRIADEDNETFSGLGRQASDYNYGDNPQTASTRFRFGSTVQDTPFTDSQLGRLRTSRQAEVLAKYGDHAGAARLRESLSRLETDDLQRQGLADAHQLRQLQFSRLNEEEGVRTRTAELYGNNAALSRSLSDLEQRAAQGEFSQDQVRQARQAYRTQPYSDQNLSQSIGAEYSRINPVQGQTVRRELETARGNDVVGRANAYIGAGNYDAVAQLFSDEGVLPNNQDFRFGGKDKDGKLIFNAYGKDGSFIASKRFDGPEDISRLIDTKFNPKRTYDYERLDEQKRHNLEVERNQRRVGDRQSAGLARLQRLEAAGLEAQDSIPGLRAGLRQAQAANSPEAVQRYQILLDRAYIRARTGGLDVGGALNESRQRPERALSIEDAERLDNKRQEIEARLSKEDPLFKKLPEEERRARTDHILQERGYPIGRRGGLDSGFRSAGESLLDGPAPPPVTRQGRNAVDQTLIDMQTRLRQAGLARDGAAAARISQEIRDYIAARDYVAPKQEPLGEHLIRGF